MAKTNANILSADRIPLNSKITLDFKSDNMPESESIKVELAPSNWLTKRLRRFLCISFSLSLGLEKDTCYYFAGTVVGPVRIWKH